MNRKGGAAFIRCRTAFFMSFVVATYPHGVYNPVVEYDQVLNGGNFEGRKYVMLSSHEGEGAGRV